MSTCTVNTKNTARSGQAKINIQHEIRNGKYYMTYYLKNEFDNYHKQVTRLLNNLLQHPNIAPKNALKFAEEEVNTNLGGPPRRYSKRI